MPTTLLTLNASQVEEMEALNTVTLTKEQWARMRNVSPNTPKRLQGVLPITWNDCLCGVGRVDGVLMQDGRLAVMHRQQSAKGLRHRIRPGQGLVLQVDHRGQFHLDGILVHYEVLLEAIRSSKPLTEEERQVSWKSAAKVQVPPALSPTDPVFEDRIVTVCRELAAKGWNGGKMPWWFKQG